MGSVKTILEVWKNCPNAYVAAIVTNEDCTTRSKLSHSMAERVAGLQTKDTRTPWFEEERQGGIPD
jgi:hypothetical protein